MPTSRDTVKPNFESKDKPTQAQFYQLFDLLRFLDDEITIAQVTGLVAALAGKVSTAEYQGQLIEVVGNEHTYITPAGYMLEGFIPFYGDAGTMKVSKVAMGNIDLLDKDDVAVGWNDPVMLNIFAMVDTPIYIDDIPDGSKICFLKRKIKMV